MFYNNVSTRDGLGHACKICVDLRKSKDPKRKLNQIRASKKYLSNPFNRFKESVRKRTRRAIKNGKLKILPCQTCGITKRIQAHHTDYMKPLEVMWFCPLHHAQHEFKSKVLETIDDFFKK